MHGRPIRTSLGSEPYGSALVCTEPWSFKIFFCNGSIFEFMSVEDVFPRPWTLTRWERAGHLGRIISLFTWFELAGPCLHMEDIAY